MVRSGDLEGRVIRRAVREVRIEAEPAQPIETDGDHHPPGWLEARVIPAASRSSRPRAEVRSPRRRVPPASLTSCRHRSPDTIALPAGRAGRRRHRGVALRDDRGRPARGRSPTAAWLDADRRVADARLPRRGPTSRSIAQGVLIGLFVASLLVVVGLLAHRRWAWVLAIVTAGLHPRPRPRLVVGRGAALRLDAAQLRSPSSTSTSRMSGSRCEARWSTHDRTDRPRPAPPPRADPAVHRWRAVLPDGDRAVRRGVRPARGADPARGARPDPGRRTRPRSAGRGRRRPPPGRGAVPAVRPEAAQRPRTPTLARPTRAFARSAPPAAWPGSAWPPAWWTPAW